MFILQHLTVSMCLTGILILVMGGGSTFEEGDTTCPAVPFMVHLCEGVWKLGYRLHGFLEHLKSCYALAVVQSKNIHIVNMCTTESCQEGGS